MGTILGVAFVAAAVAIAVYLIRKGEKNTGGIANPPRNDGNQDIK
jgi:hypothetical protein